MPVGGRRALADLHRERRDAGEHQADAGERGAERERAGRRLVEADHRRARPRRRAGRCAAVTTIERRGQRRVAADRRRPASARCGRSAPPPRVWRPTKNMLISATTTAPKAPHCQATSPPTCRERVGRADHRDQARVARRRSPRSRRASAGGREQLSLCAAVDGDQDREHEHVDRDPHAARGASGEPRAACAERRSRRSSRSRRRSGAGTAPRASAAWLVRLRMPSAASCARSSRRAGRVDVEAGAVVLDVQVVDAGEPRRGPSAACDGLDGDRRSASGGAARRGCRSRPCCRRG